MVSCYTFKIIPSRPIKVFSPHLWGAEIADSLELTAFPQPGALPGARSGSAKRAAPSVGPRVRERSRPPSQRDGHEATSSALASTATAPEQSCHGNTPPPRSQSLPHGAHGSAAAAKRALAEDTDPLTALRAQGERARSTGGSRKRLLEPSSALPETETATTTRENP